MASNSDPNVASDPDGLKETESSITPSSKPSSVPYFHLFKYADRLDWTYIVLGSVGAVVNGAALPVFFVFLSKLLDSFGTLSRQDPAKSAEEVSKYALDFVYLALVVLAAAYAEVSFWMQAGERQSSRVRSLYLRAILRQEVAYFDVEGSTGDVVSRVSSDTLLFQDAIGEKVGNFIHNVAVFIAGFAVAFSLVWQLTLVMAAFIPIIALPGVLYARTLTGLNAKEAESYSRAGSVAEQAFSAIRTVYSFVGESKTEESYKAALEDTFRTGLQQGFAKGWSLGAQGLMFLMWALMFWYGGYLVIHEQASGGKVLGMAFSVIIGGVSLGQAMPNLKAFATGQLAAYRIFSMIERVPSIDIDDPKGRILDKVVGQLELRHVSFTYPSRPESPIFEDFNLLVPAGSTVALVGSSGSGKSTVISLLERFYDPISGQVLLDGVDIKELQVKWLREKIGLVSQEPALFATSIRENILYGKVDASDADVEAAARSANAYDFIMALPDKFDTQVGERGVQMSGGQKQRIAIARAIIRNPAILLLDEATSALDTESERVVQSALDAAAVGRTTVVVAHRLSTIRSAAIIAVVQAGKIVEQGSHDDLVRHPNGAYAALTSLQNHSQDHNDVSTDGNSRTAAKQEQRISLSVSGLSDSGGARVATAVEKVPKPSFGRLLAMNRPEIPYAILGTAGAILVGAVNPAWAYVVAGVINIYFSPDDDYIRRESLKFAYIFIGLGLVQFIANVLEHYFYGVMGEYLTKRVREKTLASLLRQEVGWYDKDENGSGVLAAKLSTDAQLVRALVGDRMCLIVQATAGVAISIGIGLVLLWKLALVMLATLPLVILSFLIQNMMLKGFSAALAKAQEDASQVAAEAVSQHRTVTAFSSHDRILSLFFTKLEGPQKRSWIRGQIAGFGLGLGQFCLYSSWALDLWYGSELTAKEGASFDHVFKVFLVVISTGFGLAEAMSLAPDFARGGQAVESIFQILDRQPEIDSNDRSGQEPTDLAGQIDVVDVTFVYPSRPDVVVFSGFNLRVDAGTTVALVGQSGSGKSTIIGLVERFYDPVSGRVLIDGKDVKRFNLKALRKCIGLVQQEPVLFASSIRDNILYGVQEASEAEIVEAAKAANAHNFISSLPDGYNTFCGERGTQLSGGQKQRIAIARAILKNPAILLLDEATSALDSESEKVVQDALDRMMVNRTTIVVAHRLSTVRKADSIAVLQEGKILEQGSHDVLIESRGAYFGLVQLQSHGVS